MERMNTAKYLETSQAARHVGVRKKQTQRGEREREHPGTSDYHMQGVARSYFASRERKNHKTCAMTQ